MTTLKPNKPGEYDGKRDSLVVNTWIHKVQDYFSIVEFGNPTLQLTDEMKIRYACTCLSGIASNWWYTKLQSENYPTTWADFKTELRKEFIPQDSIRRARDKLRRLVQRTSVSTYLNEFRNIVLTISSIGEDEKLDKFVSGLKPQIRIEVLKSNPQSLDEACNIALNVDSAIYGAGLFRGWGSSATSNPASTGGDPMDIGNLEGGNYAEKKKLMEQRRQDMKNNACFKCHKPNCRPWKCDKKNEKVSNTEIESEEEN